MHYIRFLKSPKSITDSRGKHVLSAVITITTDLGDSFLCSDLSLLVELEDTDGTKLVDGGRAKEYLWTGSDGFKGLPVEIPIRKQTMRASVEVKMVVRAKEELRMVESFDHALGNRLNFVEDGGGVVALRGNAQGSGMVERVFRYGDGQKIQIWEEAGESIARHIWYALGTSSFPFPTDKIHQGCRPNPLCLSLIRGQATTNIEAASTITDPPNCSLEVGPPHTGAGRWLWYRRNNTTATAPKYFSNYLDRPSRSDFHPDSQHLPVFSRARS